MSISLGRIEVEMNFRVMAVALVCLAAGGCSMRGGASQADGRPQGERQLARMSAAQDYYLSKGEVEKASNMGRSMVMISNMTEARMGKEYADQEFYNATRMRRDVFAQNTRSMEAVSERAVRGGNCDYPDDNAADGSRCGDRAASVRPGGRLGPY